MSIHLGTYIYLFWFMLLLVSMVIATLHIIRRTLKNVIFGLAAPLGAFFSWGLISAWIGYMELDDYMADKQFLIALTIGLSGQAVFLMSCFKLKR